MQKSAQQNKEFCTLCTEYFAEQGRRIMQKPKSIKELFRNGGKRLHHLEAASLIFGNHHTSANQPGKINHGSIYRT